MKINSLWCPKCNKKGLNPYDKDGIRPNNTDDIDHIWCIYCSYTIVSKQKAKIRMVIKDEEINVDKIK